jgi:hypothetical protein
MAQVSRSIGYSSGAGWKQVAQPRAEASGDPDAMPGQVAVPPKPDL